MKNTIRTAAVLLVLSVQSAFASDVITMAECTTYIFTEINKTRKWSGKPQKDCQASVMVEKRLDGVFVTAWKVRQENNGWIRTAVTSAMGYGEIAKKKEFVKADKDIKKRATKLERCLKSINAVNDPLDCRDKATKSYLAGEVSGTESNRLIWLDDNGRHVVAEYSTGTTSSTPSPPAELFSGERIPHGVIINLDWK